MSEIQVSKWRRVFCIVIERIWVHVHPNRMRRCRTVARYLMGIKYVHINLINRLPAQTFQQVPNWASTQYDLKLME